MMLGAMAQGPGIPQASTITSGVAAAPAAAVVLAAAVTPGVAGTYLVEARGSTGGAVAAIDAGNMAVQRTGVTLGLICNGVGIAAQPAPQNGEFSALVTLTAVDTLRIVVVANATAATQYAASLTATKVN